MIPFVTFCVTLFATLALVALAGAFVTLNPLWLFDTDAVTRGVFGLISFGCAVSAASQV